jgi:hypothetical protein
VIYGTRAPDDGFQLHHRGDNGQFLLRAFHRDWDSHGIDPPKSERQRDCCWDGTVPSGSREIIETPAIARQGGDFLNASGAENHGIAFDERRLCCKCPVASDK